MGTIRCGIMGCGTIANWHAKAINEIDGAAVAAAASRNYKSAEAFCNKYGGKPFESYEDMLKSDEIDAVCICTPSGEHADNAVLAAEYKKNIIVEKPMAITVEGADRIINACEKNNVLFSVIFQTRHTPSIKIIKDAISSGKFGKITYGDVYMKFYRNSGYYKNSTWKGTWDMDGGGALMNQGIHGVDLLLHLMGDVKSVYGYCRALTHDIEVDDTTTAVIEYKSGALGTIQASTAVYPGIPRKLELSGYKGTVIIEEDDVTAWDTEDGIIPDGIEIKENENFSAADPTAFTTEGHILQMAEIFDAFRSGRRPYVDQYEGRKSVELVCAIYESSRTGRRVDL